VRSLYQVAGNMPRVLVLALVSYSLAAFPARAQDSTACPRAGTVVTAKNTFGGYTVTARGADPKDPFVCIAVSEGPGAGALNGREARRIYGWYDLTTYSISSDDQEKVRAALEALLTGSRSEVTYEQPENYLGKSAYGWINNYQWKRTGQALLSVNGRAINAVTYQLEIKAVVRGIYDGVWDLWYDPATRIWLKGHVTMRQGSSRVTDFEVLSIASPQ
jgi:hypothetical protein